MKTQIRVFSRNISQKFVGLRILYLWKIMIVNTIGVDEPVWGASPVPFYNQPTVQSNLVMPFVGDIDTIFSSQAE